MTRSFLFCFLIIAAAAGAQSNFSQYFEYDFFPVADFHDYRDVSFEWNFDGKLQKFVNAGITELKEENCQRAIAEFDQAIEIDPELWVSYYYRGIARKIAGKLDDAINDLNLAGKKSGGRAEIFVELGEIYQQKFDYQSAQKFFDRARDVAPDQADGYYGLANIAFLKREADRAIRFYKKCNEVDPGFPNAYLRIALLKLYANSREKQAFEYLDQALNADPAYREGLFWRGLINIEFNKMEDALRDWTRLVELNPLHPFYTITRGFLYIELHDFDKAFTDLKNAILSTEVDENHFQFGKTVLNKSLDLNFAAHYLMRNIYGLNDEVAGPLKKGFCHLLAGKYKDALPEFDASLRLSPSSSAYYLKGMTYEYLEQHDSAFVSYDRTLKLDNEIFEVHKKRAIYRTQAKDWKGAVLDFMEMERLQPESIVTYRLRGLLKNRYNDFYGAIVDLTRYLKVDSLNEEVLRIRANASIQVGNIKGGREDYTKLIKINPKDAANYQQLYNYAPSFKGYNSSLADARSL